MNYKERRNNVEEMVHENYSDVIKVIISYEKGIDDEKALESLCQNYMENDKEPTNVCILDSKILKTKGQEEKKNFILRAIKKHKAEYK